MTRLQGGIADCRARGDSQNQRYQERKEEREKNMGRTGGRTVATSRKQSGRRPLKILLRIVCHFTSEASGLGANERGPLARPRSAERRERTSPRIRSWCSTAGIPFVVAFVFPGAPLWLPVPRLSGPRDAGAPRVDRAPELTVLCRLG